MTGMSYTAVIDKSIGRSGRKPKLSCLVEGGSNDVRSNVDAHLSKRNKSEHVPYIAFGLQSKDSCVIHFKASMSILLTDKDFATVQY